MGILRRGTIAALAASALLTAASSQRQEIKVRSFFVQSFAILWLAIFFIWSIYAVFIYPHLISPLRHLPQAPHSHWLVGQGLKLHKEPAGQPAREWLHSVPNDGLIAYKWFFNIERVLVTSPKALAEVLVTNSYAFEKPEAIRTTIGKILGFGLVLSEGDMHRAQRKNLMPAFAFRHIKDLYPVFWQKSREVVQAMMVSIREPETVLQINPWASRCTLDIIGVAGLGRDFGAIKDADNELVQTYQSLTKPSKQAQMMNMASMLLPGWMVNLIPIKRNDDINRASQQIRSVCRDLIKDKKAKMANKERTDVDILSVALESRTFTDEQLVDQLMTFLAAGHDTTATSLTWAVYMMCRYPKMQQRLRDEVRERLPSLDSATDVSSMDIDQMPYLTAFTNEVLRVWPPVPLTVRVAHTETTILGQTIPAGTRVLVVPWATNHDKSLWGEDAGEFNPDRWMAASDDPEEKNRAASGGAGTNYAYLTFLHGPRSCIGQAFAKAEFACLLAAWVGRFEFELNDPREMDEENMEIKGGLVSRPANGLWCKVRVVTGW